MALSLLVTLLRALLEPVLAIVSFGLGGHSYQSLPDLSLDTQAEV